MRATVPRIFLVDVEGVEYDTEEDFQRCAMASADSVFEPEPHPDGGWQMYLDCTGQPVPAIARTGLRILVLELRRAGVTSGRIGPIV